MTYPHPRAAQYAIASSVAWGVVLGLAVVGAIALGWELIASAVVR